MGQKRTSAPKLEALGRKQEKLLRQIREEFACYPDEAQTAQGRKRIAIRLSADKKPMIQEGASVLLK
jgi:hypothetical protein